MTTTLPQPPTMLTARFTDAVEYARAHHTDELRKGTTVPYLVAPARGRALVLEHGGDETAAVAALLHDVVEDGGGETRPGRDRRAVRRRRSPDRRGLQRHTAAVKEDWRCARALPRAPRDRGARDAARLGADKLHNARAILGDLREQGDELWTRFNRGAA